MELATPVLNGVWPKTKQAFVWGVITLGVDVWGREKLKPLKLVGGLILENTGVEENWKELVVVVMGPELSEENDKVGRVLGCEHAGVKCWPNENWGTEEPKESGWETEAADGFELELKLPNWNNVLPGVTEVTVVVTIVVPNDNPLVMATLDAALEVNWLKLNFKDDDVLGVSKIELLAPNKDVVLAGVTFAGLIPRVKEFVENVVDTGLSNGFIVVELKPDTDVFVGSDTVVELMLIEFDPNNDTPEVLVIGDVKVNKPTLFATVFSDDVVPVIWPKAPLEMVDEGLDTLAPKTKLLDTGPELENDPKNDGIEVDPKLTDEIGFSEDVVTVDAPNVKMEAVEMGWELIEPKVNGLLLSDWTIFSATDDGLLVGTIADDVIAGFGKENSLNVEIGFKGSKTLELRFAVDDKFEPREYIWMKLNEISYPNPVQKGCNYILKPIS